MKNILLLTDFSKNSINAIHYALQLFQHEVCNFYVLHVEVGDMYISDDLIMAGNDSIYDSLVKKSKHKLSKLIVKLENEFNNENFNYEMIVDHDGFIDAINQVLISKSIDLIVMGTNGVTGAKEVLFGSNTINVIRKIDCPTLVIPQGFIYRTPKEVLLPLDAFDTIIGKSFADALRFTNRFSKKLHVLRINPNTEDSKKALKDKENIEQLLKDTDYEYHMVNTIPMEHVVKSYSQTHNIDLITLLVQKESFFERFIVGSTTTKISNEIRLPLLIFHF
jgi:nucleotide-binding universal stress UspA family protein